MRNARKTASTSADVPTRRSRAVRVATAALMGLALVVVLPTVAQAHVERPSYWPDPAPDCSISPCAGGTVPTARSLASALDDSRPGTTRVVCQAGLPRPAPQLGHPCSRRGLLHPADRPPRPERRRRPTTLLSTNKALFSRCRFHSIQTAVNASGNNDRVVVMPGLYDEPVSRAQPTHDPACSKYAMKSDSGDPGALSHDYQIHCPNDANLVAVIGRGPDTAPPPSPASRGPPRDPEHGIVHPLQPPARGLRRQRGRRRRRGR